MKETNHKAVNGSGNRNRDVDGDKTFSIDEISAILCRLRKKVKMMNIEECRMLYRSCTKMIFGIFLLAAMLCCEASAQEALLDIPRGTTNAVVEPGKCFRRTECYKILEIYSANSSNEARMAVGDGLQSVLRERDYSYTVTTVEFNMLSHYDPKEWKAELSPYLDELRNGEFDLVVAGSDEAAQTFAEYLETLPEKTAVIFANISRFDPAWRARHRNLCSVIRTQDPRDNINLGLRLFPETDTLILLASSRSWTLEEDARLRRELPGNLRLNTIYIDDDSPETLQHLQEALKTPETHSILINLDWDRYFVNQSSRAVFWKWLKEVYSGPVFVRRQGLLEYAVGGVLERFFHVGKLTGNLADQIFQGTSAGDIVPVECTEQLAFYYPEVQRLGILSRLTDEDRDCLTEVPQSFLRRHRQAAILVFGGLGVGVLILGISTLVLAFTARRLRFFNTIHQALPVRVAVYDRDGNVLFLHREYGVSTRLSREDYPHIRDIPWINARNILDAIRTVYDYGTPITLDYDFFGEQRSAVFTRLDASLFGKVTVISVSSDSSRLQKAQQEAQNLAKRFSLTLQSIGDAVVVTDAEQQIVMMNPVAAKLSAVALEDAVHHPLTEIFDLRSALDGRKIGSPIQLTADGTQTVSWENTMLVSRQGSQYRITGSAAPICGKDGVKHGVILVFRDMTEEYAKRDCLALSMALLRQSAEQSRLSFFRMDMLTQELTPLLEQSFWISPTLEDGHPVPLREWLDGAEYEKVQQAMERCFNERGYQLIMELHSCFGGIERSFLLNATGTWVNENGTQRREIVGSLQDISLDVEQRDRREELLILLEAIERNIPYPVFVKDVDDNFRYTNCNDALAHCLGRKVEEVVGHTDYELWSNKAEVDELRKHDQQAVDNENKQIDFTERYTAADGTVFSGHSVKQMLTLPSGRRLLMGISIDASGAEAACMRAEAGERLFRSILDALPANIYVKDADHDFRYIFWNRRMAEQTGVSPSNILGRSDFELNRSVAQARQFRSEDEALLAGGRVATERRFLTYENQSEAVGDVIRIPLTLEDGRRYVMGVIRDVTEQQQRENNEAQTRQNLEAECRRLGVRERCLKQMLESGTMDESRNFLLQQYGELNGAGRVYCYRFESEHMAKCEASYLSAGSMQLLDYYNGELDSLRQFLESGKTVAVWDVAKELPDNLDLLGTILLSHKVQSIFCVGLYENGSLVGYLGMDYWEKNSSGTPRNVVLQSLEDARDIYQWLLVHNVVQKNRSGFIPKYLAPMVSEFHQVPLLLADPSRRVLAINAAFRKLWPWGCQTELGHCCYEEGCCELRNTQSCTPEQCVLWKTVQNAADAQVVVTVGNRQLECHAQWIAGTEETGGCVLVEVQDRSVEQPCGAQAFPVPLAEEFDGFSQIFQNSDVAMVLLDKKRTIVAVNESYLTLFHLPHIDWAGKSCWNDFCQWHGSSSCSNERCPIWYTMQFGKPMAVDRLDGTRTFRFHTQPIGDKSGEVSYILVSINEVTERVRHDAQLVRQQQELRYYNTRLQQYIAQDRTIAGCMELLLLNERSETVFSNIMQQVGEQLGGDCCLVYQFSRSGEPQFRQREHWARLDSREALEEIAVVLEKDYPKTIARLRNGLPVHVVWNSPQPGKGSADFGYDAEVRAYLELRKKSEIILMPIFVQDIFWGYIGTERRGESAEFGEAGDRMMTAAARVIAVFLEREEHRRTLNRVEDEMQGMMDLLPLPVAVCDRKLHLTHLNAAGRHLLHWEQKNTELRFCDVCTRCDGSHPNGDCEVLRAWENQTPGKAFDITLGERLVQVNVQPLLEEGKVCRVMLCMTDMTLREDTANAGKLCAVGMAQMLRLPLMSLATLSERLAEQKPDSGVEGQKEIRLLADTIAILQKWRGEDTQFEKNAFKTEHEISAAELGAAVKEIQGLLWMELERKKLDFSIVMPSELPILNLDERILKRLLYPLCENAVNFTEAGGVQLQIQWRGAKPGVAAQGMGTLTILVKDSGCGMSLEQRQALLAEAAGNHGTLGHRSMGGVAIALSLTELLNGTLSWQSELEKGSCVTLTLPLQSRQPVAQIESSAKKAAEAVPSVAAEKKLRVIVVDDVAMNVKVLASILRHLQITPRTASSAAEALKLLDAESADLILSDLWMPEMNGAQFCGVLRQRPDGKSMRVVAVTADAENSNNFDMSGFDQVLLKPVTMNKLQELLNMFGLRP